MSDQRKKAIRAILDLDPDEIAADGGTLTDAIEMVLQEHSISEKARPEVLQEALNDPEVEADSPMAEALGSMV